MRKPLTKLLFNSRSLAALTALLFVAMGCSRSADKSVDAPETEIVATFSAKSGLSLPETTRRSLDLKLADITEQKLAITLPLYLRVYQISTDKIFATGLLTPEQTRQLQTNQVVTAKLDDRITLVGKVHAIRSDLQSATGSHEVLVEFSADAPHVAAGDFISAAVRVTSDANVVTIPRSALLENSEGQFAYTLSGEHFVRTAIKTGARNDEFIEVTDGLYAGDQVVLQPVMSLWLTELASVKGGQACCVTPPKGK